MRKVIGVSILVAVFVILIGLTVAATGWIGALIVWGITAVVIGVIGLAVHLLLTD